MKILLVTDDANQSEQVTPMVENLGHSVVAVSNTQESTREMKKSSPDLVLVDISVEGDNGLRVSRSILNEAAVPIVLLIEPKDEMLAKDEKASGALAYALKPISQESLREVIDLAGSRFEELTILRKEAKNVRDALDGRKLVQKAKMALMRRFEISEVDAFQRLKQESASQGKKLKEVAEAVVLADKML